MKASLLFAIVAVFATAHPGVAQEMFPEGPGRDTTVKICGQCHEAEKAASVKLTRTGWNDTIERMKEFGAQGTDQEFQAILEYLFMHFKGDIDRALDMNSADALDLESVLGLLRRESAAVLQYRSTRGPFTTLADLKDLDAAILRKIEAKKDRVVFLTPETKK